MLACVNDIGVSCISQKKRKEKDKRKIKKGKTGLYFLYFPLPVLLLPL
jgi:hypothetical protein